MHKILAAAVFCACALHAQTQQPANPNATPQPEMQQRKPFGAEDTTTIHIRLINGKTGQPIANKQIFLERNQKHLMSHAEEHDIKTDTSGLAEAVVPKAGDVLNPVVVDYRSCTPRARHPDEKDKSERFPISQILSSGVVAQNTCGKTTQSATPGELILYFRTMNVFEKITD